MKNVLCRLILLCPLIWLAWPGLAQDIAVGAWRTHLTYHNAQAVADAGDRVYVASSNGLFALDKASRELTTLSKTDGLSDIQFRALAWDAPRQTLVIGYASGQLDLLAEGEIVNLRALAEARLDPPLTSRQINHLLLAGNTAYVSTAFGVAVLDLARREVRDTYTRLGAGGANLEVWASATARDSLFLATSQGLLVASLAATVNRQDFRNWRAVPTPGPVRTLAALGASLWVGADGQDVFEYTQGRFRPLGLGPRVFRDLRATGGSVTVCSGNTVQVIGPGGAVRPVADPRLLAPAQAVLDGGTLWVADQALGLVTKASGGFQNFFPSGTYHPSVFRVGMVQDQLVALAGGYDLANLRPSSLLWGFYAFRAGNWQNFNSVDQVLGSVRTPPVRDLVSVAFNPADGRAYLASFQDGLLEWNLADNSFRLVNNQNPAMGTSLAVVHTDLLGNLWVGAHGGRGGPSVFRRSPDGQWRGYALPGFNANTPVEMVSDGANQLWVRLSPATGGGLVVLDETGRTRQLGQGQGLGNLPSANVTALAHDREGSVWVGTDNGIGVFFGAAGILERNIDAARVVFQNRELLRGEQVNCLAVDGGNRKWVGTNAGVWLFSADGSEQVSRFTAANSPLLSDRVLSIAIQPQTGEVFFATDQGLVSYRGTATEGGEAHANVRVFPNPVPPGFGGLVTIDGLVANARVKITDVAGRLVYQTTANGGTATWTGSDYRGSRARSGVYLVYSASPDGAERLVTKFVWVE
jgi:ligand-binding sensor domain-containing protein